MSDRRYRHPDAGLGNRTGDFQAAVDRLDRAVQELIRSARDEFSDRATGILDDATRRLERQMSRRSRRHHGRSTRHSDRRSYYGCNGTAGSLERDSRSPRRLYRDPERARIVGVCAGIARYYGMEPWVVRCIAVTGLLFFPTIVFPAYWIMYFVMDKPPRREGNAAFADAAPQARDHRSPAPELGPRLSPRYSLRDVRAEFTEVELRLRRMESHVTSGRYELQRELNRIDGGYGSRA